MATCIQTNLEAADPPPDDASADVRAAIERSASAAQPATAKPVNAFELLWHLVKVRVARLFGSRSA